MRAESLVSLVAMANPHQQPRAAALDTDVHRQYFALSSVTISQFNR